ncbi:MAG: recombinase family protein [Oscillospiraceae bacterium]|nr:recombinase family protein [Oscillospiraceae bacterium]
MEKKDNRKRAIYSRKSKYTGKGESIENQIEMCKKHLQMKFDIDIENDVIIYEDEGYTGANTNRPQFQKMIRDIKEKKISTVICYKLDRISRNVLDFCTLKDELTEYDVSFISLKEDFDTSTPMGVAMLMICSVFAQLERDTIAERIRDNMTELAKTGRWLGGITPTGFKSEKIEKITIDGKSKSLYKLAPIDEEQEKIILIDDKFLELKSLTKLETYLIQNDIKSKTGVNYTRFALKHILKNPVYACADIDMLEYFRKNNVEVFADDKDFDGKHGIMAYNKTLQTHGKATKNRSIDQWIVAIGKHKGIISGKKWIAIQELLDSNSNNRYRKPQTNTSILSGIIRCSSCNSFMRPKLDNTYTDDGIRKFRYMCELKEKSLRQKCSCKNLNGLEADKVVLEKIKEIIKPDGELYKIIKELALGNFVEADETYNELKTLKSTLKQNEEAIKSLIEKLALIPVDLIEDITKEIKALKEKNSVIEKRIRELSNEKTNTINDEESAKIVLNLFDIVHERFDELDLSTKRTLIKLVAPSIFSDGENITISLLGTRDIKNSEIEIIPQGANYK